MTHDVYSLPPNLPVPEDDDAADHLLGTMLPQLTLESSRGPVSLRELARDRLVLYLYPRAGRPGRPPVDGWDDIPGARGCTPQSCGFRDHAAELRAAGASAIFGLSTQTTEYQREVVERLHLPFPLLSDSHLALTRALRLPTFEFEPYEAESSTHLKRMALVIRDGRIEKVFYPVFPPDRNAEDVIEWLGTTPI